MPLPIVVPRLGWTMEEGTFVQWLKQDGDTVRPGDMLFVLDGEKAAQEIEAMDGGMLRIPPNAPKGGETVAVGALLAYLVAPGESAPWESQETAVAVSAAQAPSERPPAAKPTEAAPAPVITSRRTPAISPRARRAAEQRGIDWSEVKGSGRTGRIRERDIQAVAPAAPETSDARLVPLNPVRRVIAERMRAGVQTTAPVTLTTRADATNLVNLRSQFKAVAGAAVIPTYGDLLVKLAAIALTQHPPLNAHYTDAGILEFTAIHIGFAVDTDAGLVVPVLRDVPTLGIRTLAQRTKELIDLARSRRLTAEQMQGGTFTVSNLGMYGIDAFTPILNTPQVGILGVGRIVKEPVVLGEQIVPREMMSLSLTFDHRAVDGAPAARFLDTLRKLVEHPAAVLAG